MPERFHQISVTVDGRRYAGDWQITDDGKSICVGSAYTSRTVPIRRAKPELLAERVLKEIVATWLKR